MKPSILLMFSGGLDSTGAFWKLLQEKNKIYVHHMHLKNIENRFIAEKVATENILNYMKNCGEFIYSESMHEYPCFNQSFLWDGDLSAFIAGNIVQSMPWIKHVAMGKTASDIMETRTINRIQKSNNLFSFLCTAKKMYPVEHMTKQEIYNMLPPELSKLTWSCRKPIYCNEGILPCLRCKTCHTFKEVKQQTQTNHIQYSLPST